MAFKKVAEISVISRGQKLTYTIYTQTDIQFRPGKRKKTPTGKQLDYYLKVYKEVEEDGKDE